MAATVADQAEVDRLVKEVEERGAAVRQLKEAKAEKDEVQAAVKLLLESKAALARARGEEPPETDKKKKKKKEKKGGEGGGAPGGEQKMSKKQLRILERQRQAEARASEATAAQAGEASNFGELPVLQSTEITDRVWTPLCELGDKAGEKVWVRARVHTSRVVGRGAFLLLRSGIHTVQAVAFQGGGVSKAMVKFLGNVTRESVVDVFATVSKPDTPIESASLQSVELQVEQLFTVSRADGQIAFQVEDASRGEVHEAEGEDAAAAAALTVGMETRLDNRWIDLRTPANQAIMRIKSTVCCLFREFFNKRGFVEIQTPKLLGGASEGGADVFKFDYFGRTACLAQSPQLYKQMMAACAGFEKVFEVGPVFRAEKSHTHRHLCEFTGLDFEMAIKDHYFEVLDVFGELFHYIFDGINERCKEELATVQKQHPFEPIQYSKPPLRLTYKEGITLLREAGWELSDTDDLNTAAERALGQIVKSKYGTDFFILDKFPLEIRPFYTMPDPNDPTLSNSYDLFIRGEEIVSGAQRVHDVHLLIERAKALEIPIDTIQGYIDSFRHGALPHAGGGIGLERVVMLFLGLPNIRKVATFPRDPRRVTP